MARNYCPNCGTKVQPNAKFCPQCGNTLGQSGKNTRQANTASQKTSPHTPAPQFKYPESRRHSEIVTTNDSSGEPVVKFRNLHPNAVWLFFFEYLGKTSILLLLFALTVFLDPLLSALIITAYFLVLYIAAHLSFKNYEFEISPLAFHKTYGILHKNSVNIGFEQIQNVNVRRSLIDQALGLSHIEIETAGTGGGVKKNIGGLTTRSEGYIPGVSPDEAQDIRSLMLARAKAQ